MKRVAMLLAIVLCAAGPTLAQTEWVEYPDNPMIEPGEPGEWDDVSRSAGSVVLVESTYHMWFSGSNGERTFVGHATSDDGVEWTMDPANPVLTGGVSGEWDELGLWLPSVVFDGTQFHMWYAGNEDTTYARGGYATSPDGVAWTKHPDNPVMDLGPPGSWEDRHVRPGGVVLDGETYKMWYTGWGTTTGVQIGYAESTDGVQWTRRADPVLAGGGVSYPGAPDQSSCNPSVVFDGSIYHMFYACSESAGSYAFSTDGITWSLHRDNPVIEVPGEEIASLPVLFDGSTWRMWYTQRSAGSDRISYATSDWGPGDAGLHHPQYVPAAALASGAEGSFYQTDVDINNASEQPVEYDFMWLPRGEANSGATTSDTFSLGAGMSVRYRNVLSEVFGLEPNSLGALAIVSSNPDLLAMSRTYNSPDDGESGTFGQAIPAVAPDEFISSGERRRILFASETDDLRFNVGCQNGSGEVTAVSVELFDGEGTSLERTMMVLPAWGNDQFNRIFEDYMPVNGYVDVWTVQSGRSFICYGSVLDNVTSDPTTILPQ